MCKAQSPCSLYVEPNNSATNAEVNYSYKFVLKLFVLSLLLFLFEVLIVRKLLACMQQIMAVPSTIVELTKSFEASPMRHNLRRRNLASAGSIAEMSFRVVNLRAATRNGEITDPMSIHRMWKSIDRALSQWKTATPSAWVYVVCTTLTSTNDTYNGKYHTYPTVSIAEILNNWRTLRIIVNQMILQNAAQLAETDGSSHHEALATISELSDELCASVTGFANTPRKFNPPRMLLA